MSSRTKKVKPGRGPTKFRGISGDAKKLGVNRVSLYRALTGQWSLPKLVARYHEMKKEESAQ